MKKTIKKIVVAVIFTVPLFRVLTTPRKAGTTYIKGVKKVHNKKIVKKIKVIVKKPYLNKKKATVTVGKKLTLKLRGMVVTRWTSSNKKIATVSSSGAVDVSPR